MHFREIFGLGGIKLSYFEVLHAALFLGDLGLVATAGDDDAAAVTARSELASSAGAGSFDAAVVGRVLPKRSAG